MPHALDLRWHTGRLNPVQRRCAAQILVARSRSLHCAPDIYYGLQYLVFPSLTTHPTAQPSLKPAGSSARHSGLLRFNSSNGKIITETCQSLTSGSAIGPFQLISRQNQLAETRSAFCSQVPVLPFQVIPRHNHRCNSLRSRLLLSLSHVSTHPTAKPSLKRSL